jgi:hypothetical protein
VGRWTVDKPRCETVVWNWNGQKRVRAICGRRGCKRHNGSPATQTSEFKAPMRREGAFKRKLP